VLLKNDKDLKRKDEWVKECQGILEEALEIIKHDDSVTKGACSHLEKMVSMEVDVMDAIEYTKIDLSQKYLDHLAQIYLWLSRAE